MLAQARRMKDQAEGIKGPARVTVKHDRLEINETVEFGSNNAIVDKSSFPLLDLVASTLISNPQIIMVEIAGHTNGTVSYCWLICGASHFFWIIHCVKKT